MTTPRYKAVGFEAEFEPGSRGRVLRNLLGIARARDMEEAESQALEIAQETAVRRYGPDHRFTGKNVCELHRLWLGPIYPWAGDYRTINIGKGGFQFAHAPLIPRLMQALERGPLRRYTPCTHNDEAIVACALAEVHAELIWCILSETEMDVWHVCWRCSWRCKQACLHSTSASLQVGASLPIPPRSMQRWLRTARR